MQAATLHFHRLAPPEPDGLPRRLDAVNHALHGYRARRADVRTGLLAEAADADALEQELIDLSHPRFAERVREVRAEFRRGADADDRALRVRALAVLREGIRRTSGMRAFPVQLAGALALQRGCLAEMATGEGKTLVAAMAAVLAGWRGRPVHVVTVNDYLAARDAASFRAWAQLFGLSVAAVTAELDTRARQAAYRADVVYTTGKELLADFLRDRLALGATTGAERVALHLAVRGAVAAGRVVQRGLDTAIIDEADSVLIDEAVTPLIISRERPNEDLRAACVEAHHLATALQRGVDYRCDERHREIELTEAGQARLAGMAGRLPALWRGPARRRELVEQALHAREFFHRDRQYVIQDGKLVIVDESSGRLMPQRTWRDGLHQAIEAREGLQVTSPTETLSRMSFQKFFRLFRRLSGMTGTARESSAEFWQIYRLPVIAIPTHRPVARVQWPDRIFATADEKWHAVADEIVRVRATGRPVLAGTRSIEGSERLEQLLLARGLTPRVLNARRHGEEAMIIAVAGETGAVTIATNMAGRGTDIRLGEGVAALGGLHVIATERSEAGRIDRQLFGRAGRQGDPGSAQAFISHEDELLLRFLIAPLRRLVQGAGNARFTGWAIRRAQASAQARASRQRRSVLQSDQWLEESLGFSGSVKT